MIISPFFLSAKSPKEYKMNLCKFQIDLNSTMVLYNFDT